MNAAKEVIFKSIISSLEKRRQMGEESLKKVLATLSKAPEDVHNVGSLVDFCALTIVIAMWNHSANIKNLEYSWAVSDEYIMDVSYDIMEEAAKLSLPVVLINKIVDLVQPIGMQILGWRMFHHHSGPPSGYCYRGFQPIITEVSNLFSPNALIWTQDAVINKENTARKIIENNCFNSTLCFRLACLYCLEDHITNLWKYLDDGRKTEMVNSEYFLICFWSRLLSKAYGEIYDHCFQHVVCDETIIEDAFRISAVSHNIAATKYFLQRLNLEKEKKLLIKVVTELLDQESNEYQYQQQQQREIGFPEQYFGGEVFCYLLKLLDEKELNELICKNPCVALMNVISWPCQKRLEVVELAYSILKEEDYIHLLHFISSKHDTCKQHFQKFWFNRPKGLLLKKLNFNEFSIRNLKNIFKKNFWNCDEQ